VHIFVTSPAMAKIIGCQVLRENARPDRQEQRRISRAERRAARRAARTAVTPTAPSDGAARHRLGTTAHPAH